MASPATPTRLGQGNLAGATDALFLKLFSGEVLSTYNTKTVMQSRVRTRSIKNGKSYQFPAIGKIDAEYHTVGTELTGKLVEHGEKIISIDDMLVSHAFIANIDEAKNHYEVRAEYSRQMGDALAQTFDKQVLSMAANAALTAETGAVADMGDAEAIAVGTSPTTSNIITGLYSAAEKLDAKNIREDGRFVVVTPAVYYALVQDASLLNRDYVTANGDYADGKILRVAGMEIVKSNNMALDFTATGARTPNNAKYDVDATSLKALVMVPEAIGCVKLMDVASEAEYDIRRQGTLMVSKMAVGHGVLRPEGIIGINAA